MTNPPKIALVTGGGRGIGKGCAIELAKTGIQIVLNDKPGSEDLAKTAEEIRELGVSCTPIEADVFTRNGCESLFSSALNSVGTIDILVSNPAINQRRPFLEYDPDMFERVLSCTLSSGFHMGQLTARHLVERGQPGKMVFISSVHAHEPYAGAIAYNAAKAGLNHMARTMAVELLSHRINVNVIEPGWIHTPGEEATFGKELIAEQGPKLPLGRIGTPADIGKTVAFLCSDAADYITGSILRVDGGYVIKDCQGDAVSTSGHE